MTTDPAAAHVVPLTSPLMNWLVPSAPGNQGRFLSNWMLKDPACFPTETLIGLWLKLLMGTGHHTVVELPVVIQVRTSPSGCTEKSSYECSRPAT